MTPREVRFTTSPALSAELAPRAKGRTTTGPVLHGYAAVFNTLSTNLGGFFERVQRGAFAESLKRDVRALFNHNSASLLGRTRSGSLKVFEDQHGLAFELRLPDTQLGHDIRELVSRGDVSQMSFGFSVPDGGDTWTYEAGRTIRVLRKVELWEISLVVDPAYSSTSVMLREMIAGLADMLAARRLRVADLLR
ncbi:hypothetical protein YTPLAS18_17200 [Nitrospira sp.]|nr:hypothetical protein YTPLAS18_17200 [Nitrospira sp.]